MSTQTSKYNSILVFANMEINPSLKTQITTIHLFPGYSRQQVNYIYNQICVDMKFDEFYDLYVHIPQRHKLIIDLVDTTVTID